MDEQHSTKKSFKFLISIGIVLLIFVVIGFVFWQKNNKVNATEIKVGIITDLTGPAAYWGESTRVGAEIAKEELNGEGYNVNLIFEDYQFDAAKALTSAQKLLNMDNVDAFYGEFNPAAISVASFLKDKNKLFIYDAAPTSPLNENLNAYKSYLDYQAGCREVAQRFKNQGVTTMGVLKCLWEPGDLCLAGVKEVFGDKTISESYNIGDADLKTQVLKLKNSKVEAVINVAFEGDILNTFKALHDLQFNIPVGTVDDTITDNVKTKYPNELKGTWTFGFNDVDPDFINKIQAESSKKLATNYAAALAYTHIKQIVKSLVKCQKDLNCTKSELDHSPADNTIGFKSFQNRIADLQMSIKQY